MAGFLCEERLVKGDWRALERVIARYMDHHGFEDVKLVGGSGDMGADIVGSINGQRWIYQSKFKSSGGINSQGAREAVRALSQYDGQVAVLATNQYFTDDAIQYQNETIRNGIDLRMYSGENLLDFFDGLKYRSQKYRPLRSYQIDAVDSVEVSRGQGGKTALVLMATGLGKSIVANQLIANELERNPNQEVLVLAHATDLVRQLDRESWSQFNKGISTHLWTEGETPSYQEGVVFATWQTVLPANTRNSLKGRFGLVIVDEAHRSLSNSYRGLINELSANYLVGMTATPWRGDRRSLTDFYGSPTFTMDIVDGMQKGYLAEVDYRMLTDGIDWDEIALLSREGLTIKELNTKLIMPERDIGMIEVVTKHINAMQNPKALVFCRSQEHANRLQALFASQGLNCAVIHRGIDRRTRFRNLSGFRSGDVNLLLSVEMLNEGIDVPDVNLVVFMRVTHSRRIFVQQLGRGLRLSANKSEVLVLDFVADLRRIAEGISINTPITLLFSI